MKNTLKTILYLLCLLPVIYLTGCSSQENSSHQKLNEYIEITSVKETKKDNYEIEYELKKDLVNGSGSTTQNIYFDNGKTHIPLVNNEKGKEKLTIKGNEIKVIYNGSNKYIEEKKVN